jgi:hypothetical protein
LKLVRPFLDSSIATLNVSAPTSWDMHALQMQTIDTPSNKQDMNDALVVYIHRLITEWGRQGRENMDIEKYMEWYEIPCDGAFTR